MKRALHVLLALRAAWLILVASVRETEAPRPPRTPSGPGSFRGGAT